MSSPSSDHDIDQYAILSSREKVHGRTVSSALAAFLSVVVAITASVFYSDHASLAREELRSTPAGIERARLDAERSAFEANRAKCEADRAMWERQPALRPDRGEPAPR